MVNPIGIGFGTPDETWKKYGIEEWPLRFSGETLKEYKAILHKDKLVAIVGNDYKVLPNELAVNVADDMARIVAATPFDQYARSKNHWHGQPHVIYNKEETRVNALYAFDEPVEVLPGDKVQLGYAVHNAINGTQAFGAGSFTFREACANTVLFGFRGYRQTDKLVSLWQKHTKSLTTEKSKLEGLILNVIESTKRIVTVYRQWTQEDLNRKIAEKIAKAVPEKFLPDYMELEKGKLKRLTATPTLWEAYNTITGEINHHSNADLLRKQTVYEKLHAALLVTA